MRIILRMRNGAWLKVQIFDDLSGTTRALIQGPRIQKSFSVSSEVVS